MIKVKFLKQHLLLVISFYYQAVLQKLLFDQAQECY